ncbi:hypothetical protein PHLGIDRAFT_122182 [Phlebiopsis gigantea 11061_1 CR5-6]|uniref:Uncharacterized protein n=1 Tax=Phlebiopsis gigantea (strain 11061_1 CR5-6) TaxID=745531 RepID=A0A0C3RRL2_PHLG1|nr:hypothetical protein PHLGIDRAFT_122182 [Phlebiopsis gigantea 11061_1 CR5-6]
MTSTRTQYHPCLPQKLLDELNSDPLVSAKPSKIYSQPFEQFRVQALSQKSSCEMKVVLGDDQTGSSPSVLELRIVDKIDLFVKGQDRTFLHLAAKKADIPLAYEAIRIGTAVNWKDKDGVTALLLACDMLRATRAGRQVPRRCATMFLDEETERHRPIAVLLIEQHADVNVGGETPLSVAAEACLLASGRAPHTPRRDRALCRTARIPRIAHRGAARPAPVARAHTTTRADPRSPRPRPCWSGKLLQERHAAGEQPHPAAYLCHCGRGRPYGRCCAKEDFRMVESWSADEDWIRPAKTMQLPLPGDGAFRAGLAHSEDLLFRRMLGGLPPDVVDPAFLHALTSVDFVPRVWTGQLSKGECKRRVDEWNAAGADRRSVFDIALRAKIGLNGGPLYKHCEGQNCSNVEARDVRKTKCCGSPWTDGLPRQIVYCSQSCQVSDWPRHEDQCRSHKEQQLKTQDARGRSSACTRERPQTWAWARRLLVSTLGRLRVGEEVD